MDRNESVLVFGISVLFVGLFVVPAFLPAKSLMAGGWLLSVPRMVTTFTIALGIVITSIRMLKGSKVEASE